MKTSTNTNKNLATEKYQCEFCNREFVRESTLYKHICENKRRWQQKDLPGNRIGFQCWLQFYVKNTATNKKRTYLDFIKSSYYLTFVKFGTYCANINAINIMRYADWLMKNQIRVDSWASDKYYERYLIEYLREEDPLDAISRSIETAINHANQESIKSCDFLRYGNRNKICHLIVGGRISPWMLYQSESGIAFLEALDETQQRMILDYINPELWALKFMRNKESVAQVKGLLSQAGY